MEKTAAKVCIAMSGGVDSSVAAYLLKRGGRSVIGVTMDLGITDEKGNASYRGRQTIDDAQHVCQKIVIPHYVIDMSQELYDHVVADFIAEYSTGKTPNPCIQCNKYLKFDALINYARSRGCDTLATGHYARIGKWEGRTILMRNRDPVKDQSYFLYGIAPEMLDSIIFPLSDLTKDEVRKIAEEASLSVAQKVESQEICFITNDDYRNFLQRNGINDRPGLFVDKYGNKRGNHKGIFNYTIGQRKGLGIALGSPHYVLAIDVVKNTVIIGDKEDLYVSGLDAWKVNLFVNPLPEQCTAKVRYGQRDVACKAVVSDGILRVTFDTPVEAVAPGQSVVLYYGDVVLGGGIIRDIHR